MLNARPQLNLYLKAVVFGVLLALVTINQMDAPIARALWVLNVVLFANTLMLGGTLNAPLANLFDAGDGINYRSAPPEVLHLRQGHRGKSLQFRHDGREPLDPLCY